MLIAAVLLAGCADEPDPNEPVACDGVSWGAEGSCAAACEVMPVQDGPRCENAVLTVDDRTLTYVCQSTFRWNGLTGCCAALNGSLPVYYLECLP